MAEPATPPPMDEILASIRRIITEDPPLNERAPAIEPPADDAEDVLELGEAPAVVEPDPAAPARLPTAAAEGSLISDDTQAASQKAFAALTGLSVDPQAGANTLDGLVREMLRPMLKDWLDVHLPDMVERVVAREVARISGR